VTRSSGASRGRRPVAAGKGGADVELGRYPYPGPDLKVCVSLLSFFPKTQDYGPRAQREGK
jgi:hypothetical protein